MAEGGGLLNRYRVVKPYRGFESLRLRGCHAVAAKRRPVRSPLPFTLFQPIPIREKLRQFYTGVDRVDIIIRMDANDAFWFASFVRVHFGRYCRWTLSIP